MSETPLPQLSIEGGAQRLAADAPESHEGAGEQRTRKRANTGEKRSFSAFAPGNVSARSEPQLESTLAAEELAFVAALRAAGVALELSEPELARVAPQVTAESTHARRIDLLSAYYESASDPLAAQRRRATDRWFLFRADDRLNASQLLARLLDVVPELADTTLERVGGPDGTLVLRAGEDVCALEDENQDDGGGSTVSVCDVVRAVNVLLERRFVRARLVGLIGDGSREAYLGLPSATAAIALSSADYLAPPDAEALLDHTGW